MLKAIAGWESGAGGVLLAGQIEAVKLVLGEPLGRWAASRRSRPS